MRSLIPVLLYALTTTPAFADECDSRADFRNECVEDLENWISTRDGLTNIYQLDPNDQFQVALVYNGREDGRITAREFTRPHLNSFFPCEPMCIHDEEGDCNLPEGIERVEVMYSILSSESHQSYCVAEKAFHEQLAPYFLAHFFYPFDVNMDNIIDENDDLDGDNQITANDWDLEQNQECM